jgi:chromodomain-helicase-DNA-binding protein 7
LRKCCNHLFLLKGVEEELTRDVVTDEDLEKKLMDGSGKLILLNKFIDKFRAKGYKMLIFSQFKKMLEVLETYL